MEKRICKNCHRSEEEHHDSGLAKNYDCPIWTGEHGGRHFEVDDQERLFDIAYHIVMDPKYKNWKQAREVLMKQFKLEKINE